DLHLVTNDGTREVLQVDHVVAATGYRVDIDRLAFVGEALRSAIRTVKGGPVLSSNYESSVPGLYFIGPASLNSFGPVVRFVLGSSHSARRLTDHFSKTLSDRQSIFPAKSSSLDPATSDAEVRIWQT